MLSSLNKCNNLLSFFQHVMSTQTSHPDFQFYRRSRKENFVQHQFRFFQSNSIILACYETKERTKPGKYTGFQFTTFTPFQWPSCIRGEVEPSTWPRCCHMRSYTLTQRFLSWGFRCADCWKSLVFRRFRKSDAFPLEPNTYSNRSDIVSLYF